MPMDVAKLPPVRAKPGPEIVAAVTFTADVPVLVMLKLCVELLPTATFPNEMGDALGESTPDPELPDFVAAVVYPAQLDRPKERRITASAESRLKSGEPAGSWTLASPVFRGAVICDLTAVGLMEESLETGLSSQLLVRATDEEQVPSPVRVAHVEPVPGERTDR